MESNANQATHITCVECSIALPIRVSKDPGSVRVRCRFCGEVYRGILLPDPSEDLAGNIEIIKDEELTGPTDERIDRDAHAT